MRKLRVAIATLIISAVPLAAVAGVDLPTSRITAQTSTPTVVDFYEANCYEDEVVVQVVHDPYQMTDADGLACVPGDNIPWDPDGFRP